MSTKVKSLLRIALVGAVSIIGLNLAPSNGWAQGICNSAGFDAIKTADELFYGWNAALQNTNAPSQVVYRYMTRSILLPTVSNQPRLTPDSKLDYFSHFQEKKPSGQLNPSGGISPFPRKVFCDNNTLTDAGLYTFSYDNPKPGDALFTRARYSFTYQFDGTKWLITSHHSSAMPETEVFCPVAIPAATDPKTYCPKNCSGTSSEWSWSFWTTSVTTIPPRTPACECFRTPTVAGNMGTCQNIPTKP